MCSSQTTDQVRYGAVRDADAPTTDNEPFNDSSGYAGHDGRVYPTGDNATPIVVRSKHARHDDEDDSLFTIEGNAIGATDDYPVLRNATTHALDADAPDEVISPTDDDGGHVADKQPVPTCITYSDSDVLC